jgi:hypothetical protein
MSEPPALDAAIAPLCRVAYGLIRASLTTLFALGVISIPLARAEPARQISGRYSNPSQGFSVLVPMGLAGLAGAEAGPERGVGVPLSASASMVVFAEPNSLDWKRPADGIRWAVAARRAELIETPRVTATRLGKIEASTATLRTLDDVEEIVLAFRPGGGLIYWAQLTTDRARHPRDRIRFLQMIRTFRVEARR